ncbi:uncharacterized protein LOC131672098 [Phymastichus coffea]|uniref:uncharacterized protein LOC131672098 n=1 Tax=Phymastichus coffea TaxID=108790 RepID=UPI00273B27E3|nr:uncharacterized protein LOC131672098 [Phymastichus coffea]
MVRLDLGLTREYSWPFIIADVPEAIVGVNFLAHTELVLDLRHKHLIYRTTCCSTTARARRTAIHVVALIEGSTTSTDQCLYDQLLVEFADLSELSDQSATLCGAKVADHIHVAGPPVHERHLAGDRLTAARATFDRLFQRETMRPSFSQWASLLHIVAKPGGGCRVTGDYR